MDIEDIFPEDPFEPTVKYVGASQTPFAVPWAKGRVQLCAGFNTQRAQNDDLFMNRAACRDISDTPLQYRECQITSIRDESGSSIANSSENKSFAISASVGGSFLGASGRGSYEKSVRDNRNTSNISVRADHVCGQIDIIHLPQLEKDAVRLLNTSSDPINEFRQTYGDFYVAGYRVGAVNNTTISGELANKTFFEAKRAELEVKALLFKVRKSVNEVSQSTSDVGGLRVAAFDSLTAVYSNSIALTYEDSIRAGEVASANKQRAMTIAARTAEILWKEFSLEREGTVYQDTVNRLCDRGLVTELLLAPFAALREYQSLLSRRFNGH
ncbi:Fc.00g080380.m01.CDS01 [Cosmosporella sp. VM-42]